MSQRRAALWMAGYIAIATTGAVQAAPAGAVATPQLGATVPGVVETVAYRRCVRIDGNRICRWYRSPRVREYGYPENYRTGSNSWWQEMDRTDRGGRGGRR